MNSKLIKISVILWACIAPAFALPVRFLAWDDGIAARKLAVMSGQEAITLEGLHPTRKTAPVRVTMGENPAIFVRTLDRMDAEGKPLTLTLKVPSGVTSPLVLLVPDLKSPTNLSGVVFEDDSKKFPFGTFRMMNVTRGQIGCSFGAENKVLNPWKAVDFNPAGETPLPVKFVGPADPNKDLYTSVWKPDPTIRNFVIVAQGVAGGRYGPLNIKVIPESQADFAVQQEGIRGDEE